MDALEQVPLENRDYVRISSDDHGGPALLGDHNVPGTGENWAPVNTYDWYGTWKLFDLLTTCSFEDSGCDAALGNTPAQRYMGEWSDGTPVIELEIVDDPRDLPF